jgi:hypothetical protein
MLSNLYVDKDPRTILNKPNFVRIFRPFHKESFMSNLLKNPLKKLHLNPRSTNKVVAIEIEDEDDEKLFNHHYDETTPK